MATLLKRVQKLDLVNEYLIKTNSQKYFNGTRGLWISNNRPDPERPGIARGQQLARPPGNIERYRCTSSTPAPGLLIPSLRSRAAASAAVLFIPGGSGDLLLQGYY